MKIICSKHRLSFASKKVVFTFLKEAMSTDPPADAFEKKSFVIAVQMFGMSSLFFVQLLALHGQVNCF